MSFKHVQLWSNDLARCNTVSVPASMKAWLDTIGLHVRRWFEGTSTRSMLTESIGHDGYDELEGRAHSIHRGLRYLISFDVVPSCGIDLALAWYGHPEPFVDAIAWSVFCSDEARTMMEGQLARRVLALHRSRRLCMIEDALYFAHFHACSAVNQLRPFVPACAIMESAG